MAENNEIKKAVSQDEQIVTDMKEREISVETRGEAVKKIKETFRRLLEERFGKEGKSLFC
ncbi:MAG: hypothetical protein HY001_04790 [Candidatus Portnoybacteria bacterium]|nr:hypothetical protein [Candidatus Portnoybacteria bacterium]